MENPQDPDWFPHTNESTQDVTAPIIMPQGICILHTVQNQRQKPCFNVLPFSEKQWAVVQKAAANRKRKRDFERSLYRDVVLNLPENPKEKDGYHVHCYKNFTAVSITLSSVNTVETGMTDNTPVTPLLRSATSDEKPSASGIFPPQCLFCGNTKKRQKGVHEVAGACETLEAGQSILEAALALNDARILTKISGVDLVAKEAKYHHSCKSTFLMSANRVKNKRVGDHGDLPSTTDSTTIEDIIAYVEQSVLSNKRPELLTSVYARYLDFCKIASETPLNNTQSLMRNLMKRFGDKLKFQTPLGKKLGLIMYNSETVGDAIRVAYDYASSDEQTVTKAALLLRKQLLEVPKKDLPENPTLEDLKEGDVTPPAILSIFFNTLYCGQNPTNCSDHIMRRIKSSCDDALFITRKGKVKPAKQVALGVAIKSITGSKKVVQILNRFGHSLNYNSIEELETETAEQLQDRQLSCPDGTTKGNVMGLAFDNFDEFTSTLSGADTLHDTMGILYQNVPAESEETRPVEVDYPISSPPVSSIRTGRKRSLGQQDHLLEPYRKKPKMTVFSYKHTNVFNLPDVSLAARNLDLIWMMSHAVDAGRLPMWVGYNAKTHKNHLPKQEVRYMPNMKHPITSLDVIHETLVTAQICAKECEQKYGIVTYDLAAAKPAMQIQATEKPQFDDVFIMPGAFHIEMAFFKAVGKIISDSGGAEMLTDTDVLAPGSLNGFLSGKHFNRCKRLHQILALAFEILHFLTFLKTYQENDQLEEFLKSVYRGEAELESVTKSNVFSAATAAYTKYSEDTRSGLHGFTAKFWMMYIDYMHIFHNLERAIRTNNIDLYIYTLTGVIDLFFATNHVNYCRWLTKFQLDLMNLTESHPGLREILENGAFAVRRTDQEFSRVPVDLTLEQTVNADAASRLTGITAATNNYAARLRWMVTKSARASFISLVHEMAGLIVKDDVSSELRPARIERDTSDLRKVIKHIEESRNPFDTDGETQESKQKLFNINTGKATSDAIRESLLSIPANGKARHKDFLDYCIIDPNKFEEKITKAKLKTFSDDCAKNRKTENKTIAELKGSRDLMGRLVILANKRNLDLPFIFEYPLTPVPLSMCSIDGTMAKTAKSTFLNLLETKVKDKIGSPVFKSACIIDGQFLLHALPPNLPTTYGGLARSILIQAIVQCSVQVHLIFDDYPQPSLKDMERGRRGADDRQFLITGPEQKRPKDISSALKSRSFKTQLPQFLSREWQNQEYKEIIGRRQLFLDIPGECYLFEVVNGVLRRDPVDYLRSNHEEADTKICLHAKAVNDTGPQGDIVIRASDTDIAIIMLYHCSKFQSPLWMDAGTAAKNDRRYISITAIYESLGPQICAALPGFHAFTGSDYTGAFVRKGKVRPFAQLEKNKEVQEAFQTLATETELSQSTRIKLQTFTTIIYGAKQTSKTSLNSYRYKMFERGYGPKSTAKNLLACLKGINASSIPPCEAEINAHMKRASFVAHMWANADLTEIQQHPTESNGWDFDKGFYQPIWHEGTQMPDTLVPEEGEINNDENIELEDLAISSDDDMDWTEEDED